MWTTGLLAVLVASAWLSGWVRQVAQTRHWLDRPNERSSHSLPTPKGGGLVFVGIFLSALPALWWLGFLSFAEGLAFFGAGGLVAGIGWLDDRQPISARWRLSVHFCAAAWGLYGLNSHLQPFFPATVPDSFMYLVELMYLVWLLNLYNFMDGIDGLAGIEAVTVAFGGGLLIVLAGGGAGQSGLLALLAMAVMGFLLWNFPKAKLFMGDVGSGFLGLMFGLLSLWTSQGAPKIFCAWLILLAAFITDATCTLAHRAWLGEKLHHAHRNHAYQKAARFFGGHPPVSLMVGAINLFWLTPIAVNVAQGKLAVGYGLLGAYSPLLVLALVFKAGSKEEIK